MNVISRIVGILFFILFSFCSYAQKLVGEATLTYKISVESQGKALSGMEGAQYVVFLKGNQSRTEMTSSLGSEVTIYDAKSTQGYILKDYSSKKLLISLTNEQWQHRNKSYHDMQFINQQGSFSISGYDCKKATSTMPDGKTFTVYYTPQLILSSRDHYLAFPKLQGLAVQFELESSGTIYRYQLSGITYDPVSYNKFEIPKKGYRMITYDEINQLKSGE